MGAKEDEIEVTPEMIEAARVAIAGYSSEAHILGDVAAELVREILLIYRRRAGAPARKVS